MKYDIDLENDDGFETNKFWTGTKKLFIFILLTILIAIGAIILVIYLSNQTTEIKGAMRIENLMGHLEKLRDIAILNGGTRTTGAGFNASIDYVYDRLKQETDHILSIQNFNITTYRLTATPQLHFIEPFQTSYVYGRDFSVFSYSGNDNITSKLHHVDNRGCDVSDWETFPEGYIALVRRGSCTFNQKIVNGQTHLARGMIIYNSGENGDTGLFNGNIGYQTLAPFPIASVSYNLGVSFETFPDAEVNIFVQGQIDHTYTSNLIAETKNGNIGKIIVVGSHLDSVPAGPGINDNGSGSSLNLELAIQSAKYLKNPRQKIRFIWFGAEELGLLGSTFYVNSIREERHTIVANLNFDMVASPNYQRGIYNGSDSDPIIEKASSKIQKLFETFFQIKNLNYTAVPFNGRSDYGPFIEVGIPAGGLFTGAEVIKDELSRKMFGGLGNTAFDPCYHKDCDTVDNINQEVFIQNAEAASYVLQTLATNKDIEKFLNDGEAERWSSKMREWRKVKNHQKYYMQ